MAKYNIYAVAYGVNPQSKEPVFNLKFRTWEDCKPFVVGVEGAKYKGFLTNTEADAWLAEKVAEIKVADIFGDKHKDKISNSEVKEKADKIYAAKLHPVDQEFLTTCQDLGLSIHDTEHLMKMMFVNIVKYLKDNDCINELPFEEE